MRTILTTIVIVVSISPAALAGLTITVPNVLVSDADETGSFEVFIDTTAGETPAISGYQTRLTLRPVPGISFNATGAVVATTGHTPLIPSSAISYNTFDVVDGDDTYRVIDVAGTPDTAPTL